MFEIWSDWLKVRVRVALIGLGPGFGLGLVHGVSYTVCVNHFLEYQASVQQSSRFGGLQL